MMRILLALLAVLLCACTVDDTILDGKVCHYGRDECISGYTCICQFGLCTCEKSKAQPGEFPLVEAASFEGGPAHQASLRLLERQGVLIPAPRR